MPEENDISDFLFELVSADRLALLSELSVRKQRLASLSKILNCSHQECSRNLIRLSNSGFIRKDPEGLYEITTFGSATLSLIPSFRFLIRERNYLLNHDLTFLPQGYVQRIGDLSAGERVDHVSQVLAQIRAIISKGKEYVCLMTDQLIVVGSAIGKSFSTTDVSVRGICEQNVDRKLFSELRSNLPQAEVAVMNKAKIAMAINESSAAVCFPGTNGKIDFNSGFLGSDPNFRNWCTDLFEYFWSRSKKVHTPLQLSNSQ